MANNKRKVLTVSQTAQMLQISEALTRKLCQKGVLKSKKVWRAWEIDPDHVAELTRYYKPKEVAARLGTNINNIYLWLRAGKLKGIPFGEHFWLVEPGSVEKFILKREQAGEWLTVKQVALRLRRSEKTIQAWCRDGILTAEKHGAKEEWRIDPTVIDDLMFMFTVSEIMQRDGTFNRDTLLTKLEEGKIRGLKLGGQWFVDAGSYNAYIERRLKAKESQLTTEQAGRQLALQPADVCRLVKKGRLEAEMIDGAYYISQDSIDEEIKRRQTRAVALRPPPDVQFVLDKIEEYPKWARATKKRYKAVIHQYVNETGGASLQDAGSLIAWVKEAPASNQRAIYNVLDRIWPRYHSRLVKMADIEDAEAQTRIAWWKENMQALLSDIEFHLKPTKPRKPLEWLNREEGVRLIEACGDDLGGQADRALLALLLGLGLRIDEACNATFEDISLKEGRWRLFIPKAKGKRGAPQNRDVAMSDDVKVILDDWAKVCGGTGRIARRIIQDVVGKTLSTRSAHDRVKRCVARIGRDSASAHDLRRSFATMAVECDISVYALTQDMGHASITTTERSYIKPGTRPNPDLKPLSRAACASDAVPLFRETLQAQFL